MRALLAIPLLLILVVFALSNKQRVMLGLWPTDVSVSIPVSLAVLAIAGVFFVAGALVVWGGALSLRSRARRAEAAVRRLEAQVDAMRVRPIVPGPMVSGPVVSGSVVSRSVVSLPPG